MRLVICEDNVVIALALSLSVEDMGHRTQGIFARASDCLAACRGDLPDAAIVDLDLADGATGAGLVADLADLGVPSVVVSGQVGVVEAPARAAAVLSKPVDDEALRDALCRLESPSASIAAS